MIEKGLNPQVVILPQGLGLLSQREICEHHVIDLNCVKLIFNQTEERFDTQLPVVLKGSLPQTFLELA